MSTSQHAAVTERTEAEAREWLGDATVRLILKYSPDIWITTPGGTVTRYQPETGKFRTVDVPRSREGNRK